MRFMMMVKADKNYEAGIPPSGDWAARFGMAVDRFGIPWMINVEPSA